MNAFYWSLGAAVVWGIVPIIEKLGLLKIDPLVGLFYRSWGVVIGLFFLSAFKWEGIKSSLAQPPVGFPLLILGGFLASIIGQVFFYNALKVGESSKVVPLAGTYPLVAFLLGVIFLGEKFTLAKLSGMIFILLGVILLK